MVQLRLQENKGDLALFLSDKLLPAAVIVVGGFEEKDAVKCFSPDIDIRALKDFHGEADTLMIFTLCTPRIPRRPVSRHGCFLPSSFTPRRNEL